MNISTSESSCTKSPWTSQFRCISARSCTRQSLGLVQVGEVPGPAPDCIAICHRPRADHIGCYQGQQALRVRRRRSFQPSLFLLTPIPFFLLFLFIAWWGEGSKRTHTQPRNHPLRGRHIVNYGPAPKPPQSDKSYKCDESRNESHKSRPEADGHHDA